MKQTAESRQASLGQDDLRKGLNWGVLLQAAAAAHARGKSTLLHIEDPRYAESTYPYPGPVPPPIICASPQAPQPPQGQGAHPGSRPPLPVRWRDTFFVTEFLPRQALRMRKSLPDFVLKPCLRDALNASYDELYKYLPLLLRDIVSPQCSLTSLAAPQGSVVVVGKIPTVPDPYKPDRCRVDFFIYEANSEVVRRHPGAQKT